MKTGGAGRDRTGDLLNANQALSQLSYSPSPAEQPLRGERLHSKTFFEADWTLLFSARQKTAKKQSELIKWRIGARVHRCNRELPWSGTAATYSIRLLPDPA